MFGQGDLAALPEGSLAAALAEVGLTTVRCPVQGMPTVVDLLAETGIVPSKSAARRAIAGGGAYLNNAKVTSEEARPEPSDLLYSRYLVLRHGRRTVAGVEVASD